MPKVNLTQPRPEETFGKWMRALVLASCGVDKLAADMGCSRTTVYARLADPTSFSVRELQQVRKSTGMEKDDFTALVARCL